MRAVGFTVIVALLAPAILRAQNLLVSADFDVASDVDDWPDPFPDPNVVIGWEPPPMDVDASTTSGSLRLQVSTANNTHDGPLQCLAASAGEVFEGEGWVYNPTQLPQPFPAISVNYYGAPGCTGAVLDFDFHYAPGGLDAWEPIGFTATAPPGTAGIGFRPLSGSTDDPTPTTVFFDALYLPEPGGLAALGGPLALVLALRRRRATSGGRRPV